MRWLAPLLLLACHDGSSGGPNQIPRTGDNPPIRDSGMATADVRVTEPDAKPDQGNGGLDAADPDAAAADMAQLDPDAAVPDPDMAPPDPDMAPPPPDMAPPPPDMAPPPPDMAPPPPDLAPPPPDMAPPPPDMADVPPGRLPCSHGPGWVLLAIHYDGSTSARVDHWDASCDYSIRINDA